MPSADLRLRHVSPPLCDPRRPLTVRIVSSTGAADISSDYLLLGVVDAVVRVRLAVEATGSAMPVHENRIAERLAAAEHVSSDPGGGQAPVGRHREHISQPVAAAAMVIVGAPMASR
jgi:hypothetical protein